MSCKTHRNVFFSDPALIFLARHAWRRGIQTEETYEGGSRTPVEFYLCSPIAKLPLVLACVIIVPR
jgi:hypothetical protein